MAKTKQIPILGSKAIIFRNKYDVWQFRMYVKNARRYVEKSLRVKEQARAEELARHSSMVTTQRYIDVSNDKLKNAVNIL